MAQRIFTWDATGTTLHIPALPQGGGVLFPLAGAGLLLFLLLMMLKNRRAIPHWITKRIKGRRNTLPWWLICVFAFSVFLIPIWADLLWRTIHATFDVFDTLRQLAASGESDTLRWYALASVGLLTALAGLVSAPLAIIRVFTTERQTQTAEQGLITDRINKAVEGLGAQKEVTRRGRSVRWTKDNRDHNRFEWQDEVYETIEYDTNDGKKLIQSDPWADFKETRPNIEVRLGAIYALERIAQDSDRDHVRIMEILCAYIRENAPAREAKAHGPLDWEHFNADATKEERSTQANTPVERNGQPTEFDGKLSEWATRLEKPTTDISAALEVIGRRTHWQTGLEKKARGRGDAPGYRLDLRETNLQVADLSHLNLRSAILIGAHLDEADLRQADLEGADLRRAHLKGANLRGARLDDSTDFRVSTLRGAALKSVTLSMPQVNLSLLTEAYGDASVLLPDGWKAGEGKLGHWSAEELNWRDFETNWRKRQAAIDCIPPKP